MTTTSTTSGTPPRRSFTERDTGAMKTPVADMLGIEFPIVAFSHCRDVVAAVTNAGGFGVLGAVAYGPDDLETALSWIDAEVRGRPYGVDVLIPAKYVGSEEGGISRSRLEELIPEEHRHFVDSLLEQYDVPPVAESGEVGEGGGGGGGGGLHRIVNA